jgi:thioredoxin-like negative regulator of GroEL
VARSGTVITSSDPRIVWGLVVGRPDVLLVLRSTTCPVCASQRAHLDQFAAAHPEVTVVEANVDEAPDLAWRHRVDTVPHLVWYRQARKALESGTAKTVVSLEAWMRELPAMQSDERQARPPVAAGP